MEIYQHFVVLLTGICFFMFGMRMASDNLQILAADRVRLLMTKIAARPYIGILSGVALTVLLQSSGAVTVMLVNLASAGVVSLAQVMSVIVGATVGTTLTVQLISFNIQAYALYIVIFGFVVMFLSKSKRAKEIGSIVFGFGLIFYGLALMSDAISVVKDIEGFKNIFDYLNANPMMTFIVTALFTAMVQSSAVIIGLAMTLASHHVITLQDSIFWVYGANLGTTATALIASLNGSFMGRQVALAHFLYKTGSIGLFLICTVPFVHLVSHFGHDISHQIANAHTFINFVSAVIFYPFINWGSRVIERLFPRPSEQQEFGPKYLDPKAFGSPALAFANAVREMLRMTEYALELVRASVRAFEKDDPNFTNSMEQMDKKIDILNRETKLYLVRLADEPLTDTQNARVVNLIALISDIENIGDVIDRDVLGLARKKSSLKLTFSTAGWTDVKEFHQLVVQNFELALSAFSLNNKELAEQVIHNKHQLRLKEAQFREAHVQRLHKKMRESLTTSNIHLDLLSSYRRVNSYVCNLVYPVLYSDQGGLFPASEPTPTPIAGKK